MRWVELDESREILRQARTVAVLGIKPESRRHEAAFWVPEYLASVGYEVYPVPTHPPGTDTILGRPVYHQLNELPERVDIVSVFQRPSDIPFHLYDLATVRADVVWFQSGCVHQPTAELLADMGVEIAASCIGCTRAAMRPATAPFPSAA